MFQGRLTSALVLFGVLVAVDVAVRSLRAGTGLRGMLPVLRLRWLGPAAGGGAERTARLPRRLHLLSQPEELGRVQQGARPAAADFETWLFLGNSPARCCTTSSVRGPRRTCWRSSTARSPIWCRPRSSPRWSSWTGSETATSFLTAAMWVWILGVGPTTSFRRWARSRPRPADFSDLPNTAITSTQTEYLVERAYLLANPGGRRRVRQHLGVREPARRLHLHGADDVALLRARWGGQAAGHLSRRHDARHGVLRVALRRRRRRGCDVGLPCGAAGAPDDLSRQSTRSRGGWSTAFTGSCHGAVSGPVSEPSRAGQPALYGAWPHCSPGRSVPRCCWPRGCTCSGGG
jgi:hypothetical protein